MVVVSVVVVLFFLLSLTLSWVCLLVFSFLFGSGFFLCGYGAFHCGPYLCSMVSL